MEALLSSDSSAHNRVQAAVDSEIHDFEFSLVGEVVSHYRIVDALGGGGMGLVYRAEDIKLGRQVALKLLPEDSATDPSALARFEREARAASALEHPNICPIYEFGEHEGRQFLVMQLLEGQTLRELLEGTKIEAPATSFKEKSRACKGLALDQALDTAIQVANGLDAAHRKGIVHRDIKPANIFVTTQGQAKILDFGLAKLAGGARQEADEQEAEGAKSSANAAMHKAASRATPDPLLSRTGVAMGTAGYMSPEQARGEKLDARTDLFSFGLVLYEMVTGHRAFEGDTGAALHSAILTHDPVSARQLNPQLPAKLGQIIAKALEKDREARYQTAAELRTDLVTVKREIGPKSPLRWWIAVSAVTFAVLIVGTFYWFAKRQRLSTQAPPEIKFRQLTINSPENPVTSESISPNGKFLAYVDARGMHIKDIETGAIQAVAQPQDFKQDSVNWEVSGSVWFPDNARFAANAHPTTEDSSAWSSRTASIWVFSRTGEAPRQLRDHAIVWSVSPDGSLVSFGTHPGRFGLRETWLMNSDGGAARMLFETDENSSTGGFLWTRDGRRGIYFTSDKSGDTLLARDISGGPPVTLLTPAEVPKSVRGDSSWLPDGRLIYQVTESGPGTNPNGDTCNFWAMRLDIHTGKVIDKPKRLTNWTGFCILSANPTADGKRIAFLRNATEWTVSLADIEAGGTRTANMRRLTLDESSNMAQDWTNDSKNVVFTSNRTGHFAIYKQPLDGDQPELISTGEGGFRDTPVTPDDKWVFGIPWPGTADLKDSNGLMRIPLAGGAPELVSTTLQDGIFCSRPPATLCVLGEQTEDRKQVIFTSVHPLKGRGQELARFPTDPASDYFAFDVSPDGTRLAVSGTTEGPIHILSLQGRAEQVIPMKFNDAQEFFWSADGNGLYVPDQTKKGTVLLYVDLRGRTHVLWKQQGGGWMWARPSPDGRHLAIETSTNSNNVWMMENF